MKQTEMKRTGFPHRLPGTEPKPKMVSCKECKVRFLQPRLGAKVCSPECAVLFAEKQREKIKLLQERKRRAEAKKDRQETRKKLDSMRSRSDWMKLAQVAFNKFIRLRDSGLNCCACGEPYSGVCHASHYLSVGARPNLRFNENNCHGGCVKCNLFLHGNLINYRINLIQRIGVDAVETLENSTQVLKLSTDDLICIKKKYDIKYKELLRHRQ